MYADWPLLSLTIFLPLIGVIAIMMIKDGQEKTTDNVRWTALWVSLVTFVLSLIIWAEFDKTEPGFQLIENINWLEDGSIAYRVGVDGISLFFIILSALLTPICILASWDSVRVRVKEYMIAFLALETMMIGMFCALDLVLFYVFFEAVLIPMFIIIGVWGGPRRIYAAFKFFLYTLLGSILMLLAVLAIYSQANTTLIDVLMDYNFAIGLQSWLWLAFFASFAVKVPMWPVHTWLPDAHVEAPTAGSVILAGVLLKMGGYGFLRFSLPMFPDASLVFAPLVLWLSVAAIIYTSFVALVQKDMKKLIAYSSVAHMGFVTVGIFIFNTQGLTGAMMQMLSHGLVSGALFLCVGVVYDRMHSRLIDDYGGLVERMPQYALMFMLFMMASIGLPGTSGFIGEFLVIAGAFAYSTWLALALASAMILGAAYMLWLYRRIIFGDLCKETLMSIKDLTKRELLIFIPLGILVLWMGIYPDSFISAMEMSIANIEETMRQAQLRAAYSHHPNAYSNILTWLDLDTIWARLVG